VAGEKDRLLAGAQTGWRDAFSDTPVGFGCDTPRG
jgi:hypothetical protein